MGYNFHIMDIINDFQKIGKSGVGVLDKIVAILSYLSEQQSASLNEIVQNTKLTQSTVHRLLSALEYHHLVVNHQFEYSLGARLAGWGSNAKTRILAKLADADLIKLRNTTEESIQLFVKEGNKRVCISSVEPFTGLKNTVPVGTVIPLDAGSAGTILSSETYRDKNIQTINNNGWVESVAEREPGVASVSAPIINKDGVVQAAVCVSGPISRLGEQPGRKFGKYVEATAREIEKKINNI